MLAPARAVVRRPPHLAVVIKVRPVREIDVGRPGRASEDLARVSVHGTILPGERERAGRRDPLRAARLGAAFAAALNVHRPVVQSRHPHFVIVSPASPRQWLLPLPPLPVSLPPAPSSRSRTSATGAALEIVGAGGAAEAVVSCAADQLVGALLAVEDVDPVATDQPVVARTAADDVAGTLALDHVVAAEAADHVGLAGPAQHVRAGRAQDRAGRLAVLRAPARRRSAPPALSVSASSPPPPTVAGLTMSSRPSPLRSASSTSLTRGPQAVPHLTRLERAVAEAGVDADVAAGHVRDDDVGDRVAGHVAGGDADRVRVAVDVLARQRGVGEVAGAVVGEQRRAVLSRVRGDVEVAVALEVDHRELDVRVAGERPGRVRERAGAVAERHRDVAGRPRRRRSSRRRRRPGRRRRRRRRRPPRPDRSGTPSGRGRRRRTSRRRRCRLIETSRSSVLGWSPPQSSLPNTSSRSPSPSTSASVICELQVGIVRAVGVANVPSPLFSALDDPLDAVLVDQPGEVLVAVAVEVGRRSTAAGLPAARSPPSGRSRRRSGRRCRRSRRSGSTSLKPSWPELAMSMSPSPSRSAVAMSVAGANCAAGRRGGERAVLTLQVGRAGRGVAVGDREVDPAVAVEVADREAERVVARRADLGRGERAVAVVALDREAGRRCRRHRRRSARRGRRRHRRRRAGSRSRRTPRTWRRRRTRRCRRSSAPRC